jgi:hypothetical protein
LWVSLMVSCFDPACDHAESPLFASHRRAAAY